MPPKKVGSNAPKKKAVGAKGFKLPDPISAGTILTDIVKKQWKIGSSIGKGGFGEIYLASDNIAKAVQHDAPYVVKIEPHTNGPLFTEMHCYMRIARPDAIESWKKEKKQKNLGMPKFLGSGSVEYKGTRYRFMVMERFGSDLQKIINQHKNQFSFKTVVQAAIQIIDVLEYIHDNDYIHADIKASNLLIGFQPGTEHQIYLVDYGLACRYIIAGKHKEYKYDQRKAHDGTIEFTSRDAHIGAHSRRGDMEILGYNLVQWLCGKLPWEDNLQNCDYVANQKRGYMDDVAKFMKTCFPDVIPPGIQQYVDYVASMTFDEKPNYEKCKSILRSGLKAKGYKEDSKIVFKSATPKQSSKIPVSKLEHHKKNRKRRSEDEENLGVTAPKKICNSNRFPCKPSNFNSPKHLRKASRDEMKGISLSQPRRPEFVVEPEDVLIEKENQKMIEKRKKQRPRRIYLKKDDSLSNPTPAMLEIMAKMREKSMSPLICSKKHKHNGNCNVISRQSPTFDESSTIMTPEMKAVIKRRAIGRSTRRSVSSSRSRCTSPQLFESDEEIQNKTLYYSPCGGDSYSSNDSSSSIIEVPKKRSKRLRIKPATFIPIKVTSKTRRLRPRLTRSTNGSPEL